MEEVFDQISLDLGFGSLPTICEISGLARGLVSGLDPRDALDLSIWMVESGGIGDDVMCMQGTYACYGCDDRNDFHDGYLRHGWIDGWMECTGFGKRGGYPAWSC